MAWLRGRRLFAEDLAEQAGRLVMTFRSSMASELQRAGCLAGSSALWSMWHGYLDNPSGMRLRAWLDDHGIALSVLHSSGHAAVQDLQRLAAAVDAKAVVPVHTRQAGRYTELFANVRMRADGEWFTA